MIGKSHVLNSPIYDRTAETKDRMMKDLKIVRDLSCRRHPNISAQLGFRVRMNT